MESNSSEESSDSDYSTESSDDDGMETAQINGTKLQLPQGLCDKADIFQEFFSPNIWNSLSENHQSYLRTLLPNFPVNDEREKSITLQKLLNFENFKFSNPLQKFHGQLKAGYFRPDIAKMRKMIQRAEKKEAKHRYKKYKEQLKEEVVESQKKLLYQIRNLPPGIEPRNENCTNPELDIIKHRTKRRYFQMLASVCSKADDNSYSSDENYVENTPVSLSRKHKRHLNSVKNSLVNSSEKLFVSTVAANKNHSIDLERYITPTHNPFYINDESYKNLLLNHKKRKLEEIDELELDTKGINLGDIIERTQLTYIKSLQSSHNKHVDNKHNLDNYKSSRKRIKKPSSSYISNHHSSHSLSHHSKQLHSSNTENESDSDSVIDAVTVQPIKNKIKPSVKIQPIKVKVEIKKEECVSPPPLLPTQPPPLALQNSLTDLIKPITNFSQYGKITPVTMSDLEGIDMMNIPIDLDNSDIDILELNNKPELMQETHSNFLSLLRDIICSTNEHRMNFTTLENRLKTWQESPISPLNDWYSLAEDWVALLHSALDFLSGNCAEQPEDFVPYIEYKINISLYQWIGAGRDGDNLLQTLCQYWLDHRSRENGGKDKDGMNVEISDRMQTPPPPRFPTTWTVRKANLEDIQIFREQEKKRYNNPHKSFTYHCNGYESIVGPLKGIYNAAAVGNSKAREHNVLNADRPNFVTILSLVRDATGRLPNGEGTRADIVELLKCSQYISPTATDSVLQSVVSGALDRMHTQYDPCVKYDPKRKIWIYLHRNRTEEDFEKIHHHIQGLSKIKKNTKKPAVKVKIKISPDEKPRLEKDVPPPPILIEKQKFVKKIQTVVTKVAHPDISRTNTPCISSPNTSLLITNLPKLEEPPSLKTATVKLEPVETSLTKSQQQLNEEKEISEALQAIVDKRISSPQSQPLTPSKSLVKILAPSQGKSLIIPSSSAQFQRQTSSPTTKQLNQQILHTLAQKQAAAIHIIQKQNMIEEGSEQQKLKVPVTVQQQIIQSITPQQLQSIKNVTLLRNSLQNPQLTSALGTSVTETVTVAVAKQPGQLEQVIPTSIQIKSPNNLTPAQQQQLLQTFKQKILPQTVLTAQQQQLLLKQKAAAQKQLLNTSPPGISLLGQPKLSTENVTNKSQLISTQTPVVAKVLTNAAGQVISVESLLAHQKQHGSLPQGTTLRVAGSKGGQSNIIHLTGTSKQNAVAQFAVSSQNNLIAITTQPKLVAASTASSYITTVASPTLTATKFANRTMNRGGQSVTRFPPKVTQQLINAKILQGLEGQKVVQPKLIVGQQGGMKLANAKQINLGKSTIGVTANANSIRMVNATNLNLTHIGGKPVLLASKGSTLQNIQGQNVILQTQSTAGGRSLVLQSTAKPTSQPNISSSGISTPTSTTSINLLNPQNVVLSQQVKVQQPTQVVYKNTALGAGLNQTAQGHIVLGGHPVRLQSGTAGNSQRLVLASQGQGGQILAQQILLPAGFQGTAINIKALQGVKVIPLAQAHGQARGIQGRQMFARVVNPNLLKAQQNLTNTAESIGTSTANEDL